MNDNPSLNGPSRYWWAGDAGKGYGSNNYVYTYGTAGESNAGNWARWSMGTRVGRQEIQAYVPNTRATATVLYRIDIGGTQRTKRIAQRNAYGWTSLGTYDTDGDTVTITLRDNEATQHWNRHGKSKSSIGVDAIRMRCTSSCTTTTTPTPAPTQAPQTSVPGAPRIVGFVNGADTVGVVWSPPSDNGGAPITGYTIDLYLNNRRIDTKTVGAGTRETEFKGLSADTAYQVRITAHNTAGTSTPRTATARTGAATSAPSAPRSLRVSADENSATVSWSAPSNDGGAAISGYRADLYRGSTRVNRKSLSASQRSTAFTGLSADTAYQIRISAENTAGRSASAAAGFRTDPARQPQTSPPDAPRIVGFVNGADTVGVVWSPPSDNGGAPITGYTIDLYRNNRRIDTKTVGAQTRETEFKNLSADTAYQIRLTARNTAGTSNPTVANARTARATSAPSAPRNIRVTPDENSATVSWNPPSNNGGAAITSYRADLYRGSTRVERKNLSASQRSTTFTGLSADTAYQIRISAENSAGRSASAAAGFRTDPASTGQESGVPSGPRSVRVTAGENRATVSWSPPASNGNNPLTGYQAELFRGGTFITRKHLSASQRSTSFSNLSADTAYQVLVSARNNQGLGTPTAADFTTDAPEDTRSVTITLGADRANCQDTSKPCRWLSAQFSGFTPGRHNAHCYYSTSPTSLATRFWSGTVDTTTGTDPTLCWLNATPGLHLTAVIDGTQSNTIQLAGTPPSATPPSSPRGLRVSRRSHNSLSVSWSAPTSNGGSAITGYRVAIKDVVGVFIPWNTLQEQKINNDQLSTTFSKLDGNKVYHITVYAINSAGESAGDYIYARTSAFVAGAPQITRTFSSGDTDTDGFYDPHQVVVVWSPPSDNGSPSVSGYRVDLYHGSTRLQRKNLPAFARSTFFYEVSSDTTYEIRVSAKNNQGFGIPAVSTFRTSAKPGVPRNLQVRTGDRALSVSWGLPEGDDGSTITEYRVSWNDGSHYDSSIVKNMNHEILGLSEDTTYTVSVTAINEHGEGGRVSEKETTRRGRKAFKDPHGNHRPLPQTGNVKVDLPNYQWSSYSSDYWTLQGSTCGAAGCKQHFATTTQEDRSVYWYMGHLQGVFRFQYESASNVHSDRWPLPGRVRWEIYEKRVGDVKFRLVETFLPPTTNNINDWWPYPNDLIELDGEVRIRARGRDSGKRIAVGPVELVHVDVLPEHKLTAQLMCVDEQIDQQNFVAVFTTLGKVIFEQALSYVEDMAEPNSDPVEYYKEAMQEILNGELDNIINDKNMSQALRDKATDIKKSLKKAGKFVKYIEIAIQAYEMLDAYDSALPEALKHLSTVAHRQNLIENQCSPFHNNIFWQGYAKFDKDVAELAANGELYGSATDICYPEFRKYQQEPKEACYWASR
ncbi:fibronectin type III domain-containing protein [Candidatus Poriferisocius sp.]|uniref:fibronectin type III domain-containing protein n=1 Tax=Candidatus Poriferisocius sp. TaxID=3101276 RepID=UPI003B5B9F57